jgi:hypothetical protein
MGRDRRHARVACVDVGVDTEVDLVSEEAAAHAARDLAGRSWTPRTGRLPRRSRPWESPPVGTTAAVAARKRAALVGAEG